MHQLTILVHLKADICKDVKASKAQPLKLKGSTGDTTKAAVLVPSTHVTRKHVTLRTVYSRRGFCTEIGEQESRTVSGW